ncbi:MAG TPA: hypothetical protein PKV27_06805 [Ilumatobacteraceae bacterium]|nr:hypothetical protein [Ilumatobacteraceae bacterium]
MAAASLLITACGDDKKDATPTTTAAAPSSTAASTDSTTAGSGSTAESTAGSTVDSAASAGPKATAKGCEGTGATDPNDTSVGRKPARCEKGFPAPQPLKEMTTINVSSAFKLEFNSPLLLADSMGELAKENLKMNFINLKFADAVPQMAAGQIDVAVGGLEVALLAAGNQGLPVKATLANYFPPHAGDYTVPQTGLWCRRDAFTTPDKPNLKEIEKMKLASSVGRGTVSWYYTVEEIRRQGVADFNMVNATIEAIPSADIPAALQNNAINCGIILDPMWLQFVDKPEYFLAASQTPGEPLGIYAFGKRLLVDNPEIGDAFARAFLRTVNTYFNGDYHKDPAVMAKIAEATGQNPEQLSRVDSLVMDWEFRAKTTTEVQKLFIELGVITDWKTPVPEDKIIDRSFALRAVGAG